jgi:hypothetical protein
MKLVAPMTLVAALFTNDINLTTIQIQSGMLREVYKRLIVGEKYVLMREREELR